MSQQFVAVRHITFLDGSKKDVLGGTQTVDGYWPELRRAVGRTGLNTGEDPDSDERVRLHQQIRVHQWIYWHLDKNRFELLGGLLREFWSQSA